MHNVENAVAAISVAHSLGVENQKIKRAIASFRGVKRRFEYIIGPGKGKTVFIDDYAHHPAELKALINGAKTLFHGRKCLVIFQPHLFSRTKDLADGFAESLDLADEVVLLPIYPARELPVPGVSSNTILDKMKSEGKQVLDKNGMLEWLKQEKAKGDLPGLVIAAGAGDIDALVQPIRQILE